MARSRSRSTSRRQPKATSRKKEPKKAKSAAPAASVEIVEEEKGLSIDDGVVIATTLVFIAALVLIDRELGIHYGQGLLFK